MVNLGFWQLRRLDERRAFNDAVAARIDQTAVAARRARAAGAAVGDDELARRRVAAGRGVGPLPARRGVPRRQPLAGRAGRRQRRDAVAARRRAGPPRRPRLRPARHRVGPGADRRRRRSKGGCAAPRCDGPARCPTPARATSTDAQRVDIPRLAAQLPGDVVPMYVELTGSDPTGGRRSSRADRRAIARRGAAPVVRRAVVPVLGARGDRLGPGRAQES